MQQIRAMKEQCKSLNPVVAGDDSQWFVQLVDKNMRELYKIYLHLPRGFPTTPPRVSLSVILNHPWVDPRTKTVNHPSLVGWSRDSEIGRIMMDILREFTTKKPPVIQSGSPNSSISEASNMTTAIETVTMPVIPTAFPDLNDLPLDKLEALESDPKALEAYVESMPILDRYKTLSAESRTRNNETKMIISDAYDRLLSSQFQQEGDLKSIQMAKMDLDLVTEQKEGLLSTFTPQTLLRDLTEVIQSTDAEQARLSSEFTTIDEMKANFIGNRILHHKAAALSELLSAHSTSRIFP